MLHTKLNLQSTKIQKIVYPNHYYILLGIPIRDVRNRQFLRNRQFSELRLGWFVWSVVPDRDIIMIHRCNVLPSYCPCRDNKPLHSDFPLGTFVFSEDTNDKGNRPEFRLLIGRGYLLNCQKYLLQVTFGLLPLTFAFLPLTCCNSFPSFLFHRLYHPLDKPNFHLS